MKGMVDKMVSPSRDVFINCMVLEKVFLVFSFRGVEGGKFFGRLVCQGRAKVNNGKFQDSKKNGGEIEMLADKEKEVRRKLLLEATENAKKILKKGDRIRVTKCPGTKRTITFDHWRDGNEIISKSGLGEYAATNIDRLNGKPVDFNT